MAWEADRPAVPRAHDAAAADVAVFCAGHPRWAVEGCYAQLIETALRFEPLLIFLNPGPARCTEHCLRRPWEPHKYASPDAQNANLDALLSWVAEYYTRDGPMSLRAHRALFASYAGPKVEVDHALDFTQSDRDVMTWLCGSPRRHGDPGEA